MERYLKSKLFFKEHLFRPVIKESTTCVVATHQNNVSLPWCVIILWHVTNKRLNIGKKITGLEIMTLNCKISSMFPNLKN